MGLFCRELKKAVDIPGLATLLEGVLLLVFCNKKEVVVFDVGLHYLRMYAALCTEGEVVILVM